MVVLMANVPGTNTGHRHVWERPDGTKARCGGPGICSECSKDAAASKPKRDVLTIGALHDALDRAKVKKLRPGLEEALREAIKQTQSADFVAHYADDIDYVALAEHLIKAGWRK